MHSCEIIVKNEFFQQLRIRLRHNWRLLVTIFAPILLSPIAWALHYDEDSSVHDPNMKFRAAYVFSLMAIFWVLEVIPLAVTSLLPLVLFPLLGIQDGATVSKNYMKESNMIFLGSIIMALSIEYCGLHIRGALRIISIFGSNPARIMLGTMIVAATMSMWISDTSCTTMLLPILSAITSAMFREEQDEIISRYHTKELELESGENIEEIAADRPGSFINRQSKESYVFPNAALQDHLASTVKRRSKRSADSKTSQGSNVSSKSQLASNESASIAGSNTSGGEPENEGRRGSDNLSRNVSSMSIILEGVAVPAEEKDVEEPMEEPVEKPVEDSENTAVPSEDQFDQQDVTTTPTTSNLGSESVAHQNIRKMLLFAVAYSASIGGTGSLVGTGPIKVFKELIKEYKLEYDKNLVGITFTTWMAFNVPPLMINIFIAWLFLVCRYVGFKRLFGKGKNENIEQQKVNKYLRTEYKKLGPVSVQEFLVAIIFVVVVLLWLLRDPQIFPGWKSIIKYSGTSTGDSTAAMFGVMLLFILPKDWSFLNFRKKYQPSGKYEALLDWKFVSTNAPWGYILLIGSGYAIADASNKSDLSRFIALKLDSLGSVSHRPLLIIVMALTAVLTEIVSNTACASLMLPVFFSVSCGLKIHPIYLTMASAVSASYAFMLPISSPPNAIIFATGELRIREMLVNGFFLNIACSCVLYIAIITYGNFIFQFSSPSFESFLANSSIYKNCSNSFNLTKDI